MDKMSNYKLYILVRKDLEVSVGKLMVHVGHISTWIAMEYRHEDMAEEWYNYGDTQTKILLSVKDLDELYKYYGKACKEELICEFISDAGFYELPRGTVVCCGILCSEEEAKKIGLKRLRLFSYECPACKERLMDLMK